MINQQIFYKNGNHLTICFYSNGMITIINNTGHSVEITDSEMYDIFKSYFDAAISK